MRSILKVVPKTLTPESPAGAGEPLFELDSVAFAIPERVLLEPLTLTLPARRVVGLIGHNGSGKSTLVKLLARQQPTSFGVIRFEGRALKQWGDRAFARKVAYLPQTTPPASGMLVKELVALGRYPWHGALGHFGQVDRDKVEEAIALTDIASLADRLVDTLSGGERQRVWLAMLVAQDAECLLLDEPISPSTSLTRSRYFHSFIGSPRTKASAWWWFCTTSTWLRASATRFSPFIPES